MTMKTADIRGISVSSSGSWYPRKTSSRSVAPVTTTITASDTTVTFMLQPRQPYMSETPIQMKWNGTVAHARSTKIPQALAATKHHHRMSTRYWRHTTAVRRGTPTVTSESDAIPDSAHGGHRCRPELLADPPDVDVDHVGLRIEVVAPHLREQPPLGHALAGVVHELPQQCRLPTCQQHRPRRRRDLVPGGIEDEVPGAEHEAVVDRLHTHPRADPGQQLAERARLAEVVARPQVEGPHLR